MVTLVATGGGAWWTARMPEGRESLIDILKRLDGRYIPDPSPDRITEYEAMRIEEYQDEQMAWQVMRRFDSYGAVGQEKDSRGVRPADAVDLDAGHDPRGRAHARPRGPPASRARATRSRSQSMTRAIDSLADIKGRKSMILVSQGFVYDVQLKEMKDVVARLAPRERARSTSSTPAACRRCPRPSPPPSAGRSRRRTSSRCSPTSAARPRARRSLALDTGGFVVKNTNDLAGGHQPRLERVAGLLPPRLQPDRPAPGRQVPQDRGEAAAARRARASPCARAAATTRRSRARRGGARRRSATR